MNLLIQITFNIKSSQHGSKLDPDAISTIKYYKINIFTLTMNHVPKMFQSSKIEIGKIEIKD